MFKDPVSVSLFLLLFGFFWVLLRGFLSWATGWARLARFHPFSEQPAVDSMSYSTVLFNEFGSFHVVMTFHSDGLGLRPMLLTRPFSPPMFIPWNEMESIREKKELWSSVLDVYFKGKKIRFYGKAIEKIKKYYPGQISSPSVS